MTIQLVPMGYLSQRNSRQGYKVRAEYARRAGVKLVSVKPTKHNLKALAVRGPQEALWWNGMSMEECQIVAPNVYYDRTNVTRVGARYVEYMSMLEESGISFINSRDLRLFAFDKWKQYALLAPMGVHMPHTLRYTLADACALAHEHRRTFIKPRSGSQGNHQVILTRTGSNYEVVDVGVSSRRRQTLFLKGDKRLRSYLADLDLRRHIVQAGVAVDTVGDGRVYDFRVIMQRDGRNMTRMTLAYVRVGAPRSPQANISQSGHAQDIESVFDDAETMYARLAEHGTAVFDQIAGRMPTGELGLDFLQDTDGDLWLIEANSRPGSGGIRQLREWVPTDADYVRKGWLVFEQDVFTNRRRRLWGKRYDDFMSRPYRYGRFLSRS